MKQQTTLTIYGIHPVEEALRARPDVVKAVYIDPGAEPITSRAKRAGIAVNRFDQARPPKGVAKDMVHQFTAADINLDALLVTYRDFVSETKYTNDTALVVLGEVQDPHNVGAVIRSAAAFGVSAVLIPEHRQAPLTAAAVKVSAGMAFRVPLVSIGNVNTTLEQLKKEGCWIYGLSGDGEQGLHQEEFSKPSVFVLGNEGDGLREKTEETCDLLLRIPQHARCESLNASASAAVVLYEWARQHPEALK